MAAVAVEMIRTYSELRKLRTFEERYHYLRLFGKAGKETFGFDRVFNQMFYTSSQWKAARRKVIIRDQGCDLGMEGYEIYGQIWVHHMNPVSLDDIQNNVEILLDPEFLICATLNTHNAIHYGDENLLIKGPVERTPYDTCPWKRR